MRHPTDYINDILSGKIPACEFVKLACKRHLDDLKKDWEYYFDEEAGMQPIEFFRQLRHYKGSFAGRPFEPLDWQKFCLYVFFGWKRKVDDFRRFNYALIEVPKKNGKTHFAAAGALYHLTMDGEASAEVYCTATKADQARLCLDAARNMVLATPSLEKYLKVFEHKITGEGGSIMKAIAAEHKRAHGINPSMGICDETGEWEDFSMFEDVLKTGAGARSQPIIWMITTAGANRSHPYYQYRKQAVDLLKGIQVQDSQFAIIYTLDEADDWKEKSSWIKANPSWGESVNAINFETEAKEAISRPSQEVGFKTRRLNIWVDAPSVWIPDSAWMKNNQGIVDPKDLKGVDCYGGLDLASTTDLSAFLLYWPSLKCCKAWFWIPETKVLSKKDIIDYYVWASEGYMNVFQKPSLDVDHITEDIFKLTEIYNIIRIAFDRKFASGVVQQLEDRGLDEILSPYTQTVDHMHAPIQELEAMIYEEEFNHEGHPVLRWNVSNVVMYIDSGGLMRPLKNKSHEKIDGVVALIMAIGESMSIEEPVPQITGNVRFLNDF